MLRRIKDYFQTGIWKSRLDDHTGIRRFPFKLARIIVMAIREFGTNRCTTQASALTFYTLLSLVPLITMVLAVARGFGLDAVLVSHVGASVGGPTALIGRLFTRAAMMLKSSASGVVTGVGVAVLLWTVTSALGNIESSFNRIWEAPRSRHLVRQIADYIAIIVVGSVLWVVSIGIAIAVTHQLRNAVGWLGLTGLSSVAVVLLRIGRFVLIWLLFTAGYVMLPNTRVRLVSALFGGLVGAAIYFLVEWLYFKSQIGLAGYGAAYGGFAALPLFLTWVQVTWMIVLFGAELAFSLDNAETYGFAPDYTRLPSYTRKLLQLRILHLLVHVFEQNEGGLTIRQVSERIEVPIRLLRPLLQALTDAGLATRTLAPVEHRIAYQVARNPEQLDLASALSALDQFSRMPSAPQGALREQLPAEAGVLPEALARFQAAIEHVAENVRLKDIEDETFNRVR